MNPWLIASGLLGALCTAGHAFSGRAIYFLPIQSQLVDAGHSHIFSGMWHLITVNFALSSLALLAAGTMGRSDFAVPLIAAQFLCYAAVYFFQSVKLGSSLKLFQWTLFAAVGMLAAIGAVLP